MKETKLNEAPNSAMQALLNSPEGATVPKVGDLVLSVYGYTYTAGYAGDAPRLILKRKES